MHEAVVTDAVEFGRQYVSEVTQQKFFTGEANAFGFLSFPVLEGESYVCVVNAFNARITDSAFVDVAPEIFDSVVAITEVFDVSIPVHFPAGIDNRLLSDSLLLKLSEQQIFESFSKNSTPDQPLFFSDYEIALRIEPAGRNDKMNMRMQGQVLLPGLQHAEESRLDTQVFGIGQNVFNGLGSALEKKWIYFLRKVHARGPQLCGQGECDHVMWQWQRLFETLLNPCGGILCTTDGAVAVIATVIKEVILLAPGTVTFVAAHGFCAALKDRLQGFALFEAQGITVARKKRLMKSLNDLRYGVTTLPGRMSAGT